MISKKITFVQKRVASEIETSLARFLHKRSAQLYCVGTAKSGTHSIAAMFNKTVRARHEPEDRKLIKKILSFEKKQISEKELRRYILARENRLYLDVNSSQLNFFVLDILVDEFRNADFLLTIRDCYSWLNSIINDSLRRSTTKEWIELRDFRFRPELFQHHPEEHALKEKGLYSLDGYLSYWASHNKKVISCVPDKRLLIVKTKQISNSACDIAEFSGLPQSSIELQKTHAFRNPQKYGMLSKIAPGYLEERVNYHCQPLMRKFFPEIKTIKDVDL